MGNGCMVKNCRNSNSSEKNKCRMFCVPKNKIYSERWLLNCNRPDLMSKPLHVLYRQHRVCADHFTRDMYAGPATTRLLPTAVPTEFAAPHTSSANSPPTASTTGIISQRSTKKLKTTSRLLDVSDEIMALRVSSNSFDKSSINLPAEEVGAESGTFPMNVFQKDECNNIPPNKSSIHFGNYSATVTSKETPNCLCTSTSSAALTSQTSTQIPPLLSIDTPGVRGGKSEDSDNVKKYKPTFLKLSKGELIKVTWVPAVKRINVPEKDSINCNVNLSNGVYEQKLNLMTHRAIPSNLNTGNAGQNVKPEIKVMNSNCKTSGNVQILFQNHLKNIKNTTSYERVQENALPENLKVNDKVGDDSGTINLTTESDNSW